VILEVVITAQVDHGRGLRLRGGKAFVRVRKNFTADFQTLAEGIFQQESAVGEIAVTNLRSYLVAGSAVEQPMPDVLLQLNRKFVPDLANAEPFGVTSGWHFKHGEGADLWE